MYFCYVKYFLYTLYTWLEATYMTSFTAVGSFWITEGETDQVQWVFNLFVQLTRAWH